MRDGNLEQRSKETKVNYCLSLGQVGREGYEIVWDGRFGCGFYQKMPCNNQGELLHNEGLTPIYVCNKKKGG